MRSSHKSLAIPKNKYKNPHLSHHINLLKANGDEKILEQRRQNYPTRVTIIQLTLHRKNVKLEEKV